MSKRKYTRNFGRVMLFVEQGRAYPEGRFSVSGSSIQEVLYDKTSRGSVPLERIPEVQVEHPGWLVLAIEGKKDREFVERQSFSGPTAINNAGDGVLACRTEYGKDLGGYERLRDWSMAANDQSANDAFDAITIGVAAGLVARAGSHPPKGCDPWFAKGWEAAMQHRDEPDPGPGKRYAPPLVPTKDLTSPPSTWCQTMTPNGDWGDFIRGEWWLTEHGAEFADQNVGEQGHEAIAVNNLWDAEQSIERARELATEAEEAGDEERAEEMSVWAEAMEQNLSEEHGSSSVFFSVNVPDEVGEAGCDSPEIWRDMKRDARVAYAKHKGAIQVVGKNFYAWTVNAATIRIMQDHIAEQADEEIGVEMPDDLYITVEEGSTNRFEQVLVGDFMLLKYPRDLWATKYTANAPEFYRVGARRTDRAFAIIWRPGRAQSEEDAEAMARKFARRMMEIADDPVIGVYERPDGMLVEVGPRPLTPNRRRG